MSSCPRRDTLIDWAEGLLPVAEGELIESHLDSCDICNETLDQYETSAPRGLIGRRLRALHDSGEATTLVVNSSTAVPAGYPSSLGPYEIRGLLGSGGMGEVFLAYDARLERLVAIKSPKFTDPCLLQRFVQEAKLAAQLRHPYVCPVYDVLEVAGRPCMVLEYVDGVTLEQWAREAHSATEIATLVQKVATGVSFAHQHQIVHRDLKPQNVLVDRMGNPRILDFGLAKLLDAEGLNLTMTAQLLGTPAYMAPEQARGDHAAVDARTDVYALGAILYRLFAGRPPLVGDNLLLRIPHESPLPLSRLNPETPRDLETICLKAMCRESRERYANAEELAIDLKRWLEGQPILGRRVGLLRRTAYWARPRRRMLLLTAACVAAITVLGYWAAIQRKASIHQMRLDRALSLDDNVWERRAWFAAEINELQRWSQASAASVRERVLDSVRRDVEQRLRGSRLSANEAIAVEEQLDWLTEQGAVSLAELRRMLELRRSRWRRVASFPAEAPPTAEVTMAADVERTPLGIRSPPERLTLFTLPADAGELEFQATFTLPETRLGSFELMTRQGDQPPLKCVLGIDGRRWSLAVYHGDERLRVQEFLVPERDAGRSVSLRMTLEGGAYNFAANERYQLRFFPLASVRGDATEISAAWPKQSFLVAATVDRADPPVRPSELQAGDIEFLQKNWAAARENYTAYLNAAPDGPERGEALFKRGMCSLKLDGLSEAVEDLQAVAFGDESLYRASALCHCWWALRRLGEFDRASGVYNLMATSVSPQSVLLTLSEAEAKALLETINQQATGVMSLFASQNQIDELERLVSLQRIVDPQFQATGFENRFSLLRLYHASGNLASAARLGQEICDSPFPMLHAVTETSWVLRMLGDHQQALELVDRHLAVLDSLAELPAGHRCELEIERARVLFSLGELEQSAQQLDQCAATADLRYRIFASHRLLSGLLRRIAGDEPGAQRAWNEGRWTPQRGGLSTGTELIYATVLEALASEGSDLRLKEILQAGLFQGPSDGAFVARLVENNVQPIIQAVRPALDTPRGREAVLDLGFQRVPFTPSITRPLAIIGHQVMLQTCAGHYEEDDFPVSERFVLGVFDDLTPLEAPTRALTAGAIVAAWQGFPQLAFSQLSDETQFALAFLLAQRYRAKSFAGAESLWDRARAAPADSPVRQRVEARHHL